MSSASVVPTGGKARRPLSLLVVLVFWLAILCASFSLFGLHNPTVILVLCACTLSGSAAIFLISDR